MFGAWQAGVWLGLAGRFRPDMVIGASVGSLNGWVIAGGCPPEELAESWLDPAIAAIKLKMSWPWLGVFDRDLLRQGIERLAARWTPQIDFGAVAVELPRLKAKLFRTPGLDWRHLAASCAIPGGFPPVRIEGKLYCDGGLMSILPLWAAAQEGAVRTLAVNALPRMPSRTVRFVVGGVRAVRPAPVVPQGFQAHVITPSEPLGSLSAALYWKPENARRWLDMGIRDGKTISLPECFERQ
jgi:predicted acylesterase/phospholipase RssA